MSCGFSDCVCVCWGEGVGQTDLVMKGLEIASHHGGGGEWSQKVLKYLQSQGGVVMQEDQEKSWNFLDLAKCIQPYPCALLNTCRLGVEA